MLMYMLKMFLKKSLNSHFSVKSIIFFTDDSLQSVVLNAQKLKNKCKHKEKTHTIYVVRQLAYVHGRAADSYNAERKFTERLTIQSLYFSQLHSIFALSPLLFQGALSSCFRELMTLYRQQSVCELINCWA